MTIQDLYDWAMANNVTGCEVEIHYRDDGGYYYGTDDLREDGITIENKNYGKIVVL